MLSFISAVSVLLLVTITAVRESAVPVVRVEVNGTAVLPCTARCSGVVSWTVFHKSSDPLVQCDQTECRSVKEGYQMIYNQYLKGDFSLIISKADFSKRGLYTCNCDGKVLCDVQLQIEALKTTVQIKPGKSLLLNLYIPDPVEVTYSSTDPGGPSSHQICRVDRRIVQLSREYSERASVSSALELRGVKESDSGVYTVRDTSNNEIIHIYTVIVHGVSGDSGARGQEQKPSDSNSSPSPDCQQAALPGWVVPVLVTMGVLFVGSVVGNVVQRTKSQRLQRGSTKNGDPQNAIIQMTEMSSPGEGETFIQK